MITETPPEVLSPSDLAYMSTLNERGRRCFLATRAADLKTQGLSCRKVSKIMGTSTHTLQNGRQELLSGEGPGDGRIRRTGAGRKSVLPRHPEWTQAVVQIIEPHTTGLPQDENVVWISLSVTQIMNELSAIGYDISRYFVRQILDSLGLRERSFYKDLPMKDVKDRNEQFEQITAICEEASSVGLPIVSIDTKKKEMLGNFKREGKTLPNGPLKSLDHDFSTFSYGQIVPHGIYGVTRNVGHMTLGISHDTSRFVCDNIARVWEQHLKWQYPDAHTLVILCDGGGSNSSAHRIVKQDLMDLANKLGIRLLVVHYPPYCSKFNPIEHRLFSQITRNWSGAPLMSLQNAADRAAMTTTKKGLKVHVHINSKTYDIKRPIDESYQKRLTRQVVFAQELGKWNYLVKPVN